MKAELFTEEQAELMYRAGFRWVLCGFEAANERILTNIDKRATLKTKLIIVIALRSGKKVQVSFARFLWKSGSYGFKMQSRCCHFGVFGVGLSGSTDVAL